MRILVAADVHGSREAPQLIRDRTRELKPDVVVLAGDLTHFGPAESARKLLSGIPVPTLAVPGNCDPRDLVPLLESLGIGLHARKAAIGGHMFVGIGGSNPTPFRTLFESTEEEILASARPLMERGAILVSHAPPKGFVDTIRSGEHVGSTSIRAIVDEFEPPLVLCGHIHEARGVARHGRTTIVNSGPAVEGHMALATIDGSHVGVTLL
jgi:Icc-related predicted phosphoesterase